MELTPDRTRSVDCFTQYKLKLCVSFKTFLPRRLKSSVIRAERIFAPATVAKIRSEIPGFF